MKKSLLFYCIFFGVLLSIKSYSQSNIQNDVQFKMIAEGTDSPISELQIVCFNKYFNKDYLPDEFREKYNLNDKSLYKKKMLIEIFHSDKEKNGLDKIELIGIKESESTLEIKYNTINSNLKNDDKELSPFLIVQIPKSKKEIKFIVNGVELGKTSEAYIDN
ncbi:hypothetical protein [Pontimicrobium aquaticum]|uniref:Uncharacterized protein n=1 Tax=Pontimicrobium aquaticum TaxID=2565367 RepID=A0A4U0EVX9_9FLAO|nr:hypothetical protein [Pontimicrobium aquaticum]TJY35990.1 hypothetical protein E5167_09000 [Pontimicrobium aquaticum]